MPRKGNNIYHRKDGRWEGRFYQKGSRKYKSVYGHTCKEVREKLRIMQNEVLVPSRTCYLKFSDITSMWLETRKGIVKLSSYVCYRNKMEKHIMPYFKDKNYSSLTANDLENFKTEKLAQGYSEKYVDMVVMLKSISKYASETHGYANPFAQVQPPKVKHKEVSLLSAAQQKSLIQYCRESHSLVGICCFLSMFTGLRIGELCALRWENIDLEQKVIHVRNTVQRISVHDTKRKSAVMVTSPKTETSLRDIPLPEFLVRQLKAVRCKGNCYLVSGSEKLIEPRSFTNRFKSFLKKANLPSVKFHSLRHTFATNFLRTTNDIKSLSELLGHSSANVTLRIYIHSSMERKTACMESMQTLL